MQTHSNPTATPVAPTSEQAPPGFRPLGRPVLPEEAGARLDAFLADRFRFLSRSTWQRRISVGEVIVNGRASRPSQRVRPGDQPFLLEAIAPEPEIEGHLPELYREESVLAVSKGGDLPMHENGRFRTRHVARLLADIYGPEWAAVHRLDKETSGVVLAAATPDLRTLLSEQFCRGLVRKEYLALVHGCPTQTSWVVEAPIGDRLAGSIRIKKCIRPDGQYARTEFEVLSRGQGVALLRAIPRTGRTNQIRIHAAHSGHHLLGDKLYHPDEAVFLRYFEAGTTPDVVAQTGHHRLALHAFRLGFEHPKTAHRVLVEAPFPADLATLAQAHECRVLVDATP